MKQLESYLAGRWQRGSGRPVPLVNPATGEVLAECASEGLDVRAALDHARSKGGPALRELGFGERARRLEGLSGALHAERDELIEIATQNGGNTRSDAKFDIDPSMLLPSLDCWRGFTVDQVAESFGVGAAVVCPGCVG